uniref:Chloride channel CLIC-like protein 1 n=1 Tax=Serinus canaria TaxID=9135 RepID=A0A8C9NB16_SERCA
MLFPLVLCAVMLIGSCKVQEDEWIDPTDMLNYDAASGTMRRPYKVEKERPNYHDSEEEAVDTVSTEISRCSRVVDSLQHKIAECEKRNAKSQESRSFYIFKRFLNKILNEAGKLGLPGEDVGHVHYDAEIILTRQTYLEILRFVSEEAWQPGALDEALSDILVNFKHHDDEAWRWRFEDTFGIDLYHLLWLLLCVVCIVIVMATELRTYVSRFVQLKYVLFLTFLVSFVWNWFYLYRLAFAQHQAEMAKMGQFDKVCAEKLEWYGSLVEWLRSTWTFQDDPCKKYYEILLVNPVYMVPPSKALAVTFTNFVTEPLKDIGQGIGEFIKALMKEIPLILQVPVLITMALGVLTFCYGAGSSVSALRHLRSSQKKSLPLPANGQEQIAFGQYDGRTADEYYVQQQPYVLRGHQDRGDAAMRPLPRLRAGNGSRSPDMAHASDQPDAQNRLYTESEVHRLETLQAENLSAEAAFEQQKQETSKVEGETGENCDPNKNLERKSSATEPCEEKKESVLHDSRKETKEEPGSAVE